MRSHAGLAMLLFLALAFSGCQPAPEPTDADVEAIRTLATDGVAAFNSGDVTGLVALYTEDARRFPPDGPSYAGRDAIERAYRDLFGQFSAEMLWPTDRQEIIVSGSWAYHCDDYTVRLAPLAGGEAMEISGSVIIVCHRDADGSWRFAREIWTTTGVTPRAGSGPASE